MFKGWNWARIVTGAVGILTMAAGVVLPLAAPFTTPIGAGILGFAVKAPGTFTADDLAGHAKSVAAAAANAAVQNLANTGSLSGNAMARAATEAAAQALAVVPSPRL